MKKFHLNKKIILSIIIIVAIIIIATIMIVSYKNNILRENSIFHIKEIVAYNNASVIDNSIEQNLDNLSISQYSDLSVFLDNTSLIQDLTDENTIKQLYIDNIFIEFETSNGERILNYKNPFLFAKYKELATPIDNRIDFKIIKTNDQNSNSNYDEPVFFTDCSNPITLGYVNKNIIKNYSVSRNINKVSYNAKVLKEANMRLQDLNTTLNFTINIVNNINHKFTCDVKFDLYFDNDFLDTGYSYVTTPFNNNEYSFTRK